MTWAALLLAAAVLILPRTVHVRFGAGAAVRRPRHVTSRPSAADPLDVASSLDLLAVCLTAGMAVPAAAAAAAPAAPPRLDALLRRAADMLALGADPSAAWADTHSNADPHCESLLRLARRSASSGAALAAGVAELAEAIRHDAGDAARATAERASVLIAGPLGLCYLPAFVCLGIVPVVAGLAGDVLGSGLT